MKEQDGHICPTCERKFEKIGDYPRVFIASVSLITPDEVPAEVPHQYIEDLLEAPKKGWNRKLVPPDVLAYFRDHQDQNKLVHTDDFIYHRPFNQGKEFRAQRVGFLADCYSRQFNYARMIKTMLTDEMWQKYLVSLQQKVGQEVPTEEMTNPFYIGRFRIGLIERPETSEYLVSELGVWEEVQGGARYTDPVYHMLLPIGTIHYEGRLNQP